MNLFTRQRLTETENKLTDTQGESRDGGAGGINEEVEINVYTLQYTEQMIIEVLLYSTGNYIHYLVITCYIKEKTEKEEMYIV